MISDGSASLGRFLVISDASVRFRMISSDLGRFRPILNCFVQFRMEYARLGAIWREHEQLMFTNVLLMDDNFYQLVFSS